MAPPKPAPLPEMVELLTVPPKLSMPPPVPTGEPADEALVHGKLLEDELCAAAYREHPHQIVAAYRDVRALAVDGKPRGVGYGRQLRGLGLS